MLQEKFDDNSEMLNISCRNIDLEETGARTRLFLAFLLEGKTQVLFDIGFRRGMS